MLHAFKYLTATGQAKSLRGRVTQSVGRLTGYEMRSGIAQAFTEAVREPIAVVAIMIIVMIQLIFMQQPLAPIMVSILLFCRGMNLTLSMQGTWQQTLNQVGSLAMVWDEFADQAEHREPDGQRPAPALAERITPDRVSFAYDDSLRAVIEDVSISIPARISVALVGESGAGKSTLVDLMPPCSSPSPARFAWTASPGQKSGSRPGGSRSDT